MKQVKKTVVLFSLFLVFLFCFNALPAKAQRNRLVDSTNVSDHSYGKGRKITKVYQNPDFDTTKEEFYDGNGNCLQVNTTKDNDKGEVTSNQRFFDAKGNLLREVTNKSYYGTDKSHEEIRYDSMGNETGGTKWDTGDDGKKKTYIRKNRDWVEQLSSVINPSNEIYANSSGNPSNELFVYAITHFEDSYSRFNTYGVGVSFTYPAAPHVGIIGNTGVYFGSSMGTNYTKYQLLGGVALLPATPNSSISFSPHLLAGLDDIHSKYKNGAYSYSDNSIGFSAEAGFDVRFPLNNHSGIKLRADYEPSFSGGVKNNFGVGIGVAFNTGHPKTKKNPAFSDREKIPKVPQHDNGEIFYNVVASDFDHDPPIFKYGDSTKKQLQNPYTVKQKYCDKGDEEFEYDNNTGKDVVATLIVKNNGECRVYVFVDLLLGAPPKGGQKLNGGGGNTKDKNEMNAVVPRKKPKENSNEIMRYGVDGLQGSDIHSFTVKNGARIRVYLMCYSKANTNCNFTREFTVTTDNSDPSGIPRLPIDSLPPVTFARYDTMGNRCISKDLVFDKITNLDVTDTMTVYFKAVSNCDCYFEAYSMDYGPKVRDNQIVVPLPSNEESIQPKTGGPLGKNADHNEESEIIAKPNNQPNATNGKEMFVKVQPGHRIYIFGRCPFQYPRGGPCKGAVQITGITYTRKAR